MQFGGFILGKPTEHNEMELGNAVKNGQIIRRFPAFLWGKVIKPVKVSYSPTKGNKKVEFTVQYGRKQKVDPIYPERCGFRDCVIWGDCYAASVAENIELGEWVLCLGEWRLIRYVKPQKSKRKRGGIKKNYYEMSVQIVIPMSSMAVLANMVNSHHIKELLEADANMEADPMESMEHNAEQ